MRLSKKYIFWDILFWVEVLDEGLTWDILLWVDEVGVKGLLLPDNTLVLVGLKSRQYFID